MKRLFSSVRETDHSTKDYTQRSAVMQRTRRRCEGTAMGATVFDLRPGVGIGPFSIGMPICDAFAQIEQQPNIYDVVHVKYHDEDPLKLDIVISFPDHGFHLRFDPWSQRLRLVEIYDVKRLQMRYATSMIGGPSTLATFVAVYALFGPTFPGIYDKERGVYSLFYPGLSFQFPIPNQYTDCCHDGEAALPLEFPDGTTPVTCRVSIYDNSSDKKVGVGKLMDRASVPPLPPGSLYMEEVHVKLGKELYFTVGGQHMPFGASPQDVWTDLGRPCGIHPKQVDQMVIHSASDPRPKTTLCGDYFYNYFTRGMDILFDGETHRAKKFVLHTNYPGHADFNSYIKCNFVISVGESEAEANRGGNKITPRTNWEQVKEILGECGPAAIQTQGSTSNPFGSTYVYGYQNVAFEVMKNGHIATITLFHVAFCCVLKSSTTYHVDDQCVSLCRGFLCFGWRGYIFYYSLQTNSFSDLFSSAVRSILLLWYSYQFDFVSVRLHSSNCEFRDLAEMINASGLTLAPPKFHFLWRSHRFGTPQRSSQALAVRRDAAACPLLQRACLALSTQRSNAMIVRAMSASFGDMSDDSSAVFPRINVKDPYKRLGISRMASEDEIQGARNFLIQQYAGHKPSVDAIESAHDKIIMQKFHERKNPKIDINKKVRQVRQSKVVSFVFDRFQTPPNAFLVKTAVTYAVLGALTVLFPTEEGPTLQVLLSVIATFYFIHQRLKKKLWSFLYGTGSFIFSWLIGTFLMVSVIPPFIKGPRGFEVMSSLLSYVLLWVASSYLR
ncbi:hypothetical protein HID58_012073 [Brassica napus]|uniref:Uncharacterized protein n=2 Tax=Brassica napus TaxID=3708 RepID=A0ABQ8E2P0_BRANA|nr:hypothetical protein HID58_012073 [Brassica napus]